MISPIIRIESGNSLHEHPESQHSRATVNEVTYNGTTAPSLFFLAKHARQDRNYSDKLKETEGNGTNPPPHLRVPPK
ncbi:hypothetical protein ACFLVZ_03285 [Chloroflexota bacterium]